MMNELERIKSMASELAEKAPQATAAELALALKQITAAYKTLSEIDKSRAETRKLTIDEEKARYDLRHASRHEKSEDRQRYITILVPIATTLILGFTLLLQAYQFSASERDKQQASEDTQWSEAVKTVSESAKLSPIAMTLNPFLKSTRYSNAAKRTAVQALLKTRDPLLFADLFRTAFVPLQWNDFDAVLELDRSLNPRLRELSWKARNEETNEQDLSRLPVDEKQDYTYIDGVLKDIGMAMGLSLRRSRPQGQIVDLSSGWFQNCDWSGANLYGVRIENMFLRYAIINGADLGGITSFDDSDFYGTAWWDANRISPGLLTHLIKTWPYKPTEFYGLGYRERVSPVHYDDAIARLKSAK